MSEMIFLTMSNCGGSHIILNYQKNHLWHLRYISRRKAIWSYVTWQRYIICGGGVYDLQCFFGKECAFLGLALWPASVNGIQMDMIYKTLQKCFRTWGGPAPIHFFCRRIERRAEITCVLGGKADWTKIKDWNLTAGGQLKFNKKEM